MTLTELLERDEMKQYGLINNGTLVGYWQGDRTASVNSDSITRIDEEENTLNIKTESTITSFWKEINRISTVIF